jgi:hypothetical protein
MHPALTEKPKPFIAPRMDEDPPPVAFFRNFFPDARKLFEWKIFKMIPGFENFSKRLDEIGVVALIVSIGVLIIASICLSFISIPLIATILVTFQIISAVIAALILGSFGVRYFSFKERAEEQRIINQCSQAFEESVNKLLKENENSKALAAEHKAANLDHKEITQEQKTIVEKLKALQQQHHIDQCSLKQNLLQLEQTLAKQALECDQLKTHIAQAALQNSRFELNNQALEQQIEEMQTLLAAPEKLASSLEELKIVHVNLAFQQELLKQTKLEVTALSRTRETIDKLLKKYSLDKIKSNNPLYRCI